MVIIFSFLLDAAVSNRNGWIVLPGLMFVISALIHFHRAT